MLEQLLDICANSVDCLDDALKQWAATFGADLHKTWDDPAVTMKEIVTKTRNFLNKRFARHGECSLFIRVPISDHLNIVWSTVTELQPGGNPEPQHFAEIGKNYDSATKTAYYDLCTRLGSCRSNNEARKKRGLTGWVAVTGYPVLLNHAKDKVALDRFSLDHRETKSMCQDYGQPHWSQRISEFHQGKDAGNRRFVAVPVLSAVDFKRTIGVLRYTCLDLDPEITLMDQGLLEGAAQIISALENLKQVKIKSSRALLADGMSRQFQSDGDFSKYLEFIAKYTLSEIASLYICLGQGSEARLRLADGFGLPQQIGMLRKGKGLHDYTEKRSGLTWKLQSHDFISYQSAAAAPGWTGRNTSVFYAKAFPRVGRPDFASLPSAAQKQLVEDYGIQLLGGRLRIQNESGWELCGVLKVEFPQLDDAEKMYDKDDEKFLKDCSDVLAQELRRYRQLYDGTWFRGAGPEKAVEYLRLLNGVARMRLFRNLDDNWLEQAADYVREHNSAIEAAVHGNDFMLLGPEWTHKRPKRGSAFKAGIISVLKSAGTSAGTEVVSLLIKTLAEKYIGN